MSATFDNPKPANPWLEWLPVLCGLLALYVPTLLMLAADHWPQDDEAHQPIILAVVLWLLWTNRAALLEPPEPAKATGSALIVFALLVYVFGRSQSVGSLEAGSLVPLLAGVVLCMRGWQSLSKLWFPIVFAVFYVPLPGVFVDWITGPLRQQVSALAEITLYTVGYPVARNGVVLTIGPYQLLVADACAGLNSMFSLSALGTLYLFVVKRPSLLHNAIMLAAVIPTAFFANFVRVMALMLITYHFGDEAGQGFLHGATGMLLFVVALLSLMLLDTVLSKVLPRLPRFGT